MPSTVFLSVPDDCVSQRRGGAEKLGLLQTGCIPVSVPEKSHEDMLMRFLKKMTSHLGRRLCRYRGRRFADAVESQCDAFHRSLNNVDFDMQRNGELCGGWHGRARALPCLLLQPRIAEEITNTRETTDYRNLPLRLSASARTKSSPRLAPAAENP